MTATHRGPDLIFGAGQRQREPALPAPDTPAQGGLALFECPRHVGHLRLSKPACAAAHVRARRAAADSFDRLRLDACRDCPIGAGHAGLPLKLKPSGRSCARCGREDLRLVGGRICIGCYNREREWRAGHSFKGHHVRIDLAIASWRLLAIDAEGAATAVHIEAAGLPEALILASRRHPERLFSIRPPPRELA